MQQHSSLAAVPDVELLERLSALLHESRHTEADLVAHIGEVDRRRLYARAAAPSMFAYCIDVLHLSEAEAYLRIAAARAARQHPQLLAMLCDGRLHLSAIAKLSPHLTPENRDAVLRRAAHRSKREVEQLVAELSPRPDVPCLVRRLPGRLERAVGFILPSSTVSGAPGDASRMASNSGVELRPDGVGLPVESVRGETRLSCGLEGTAPESRRESARPVVEALAPSRYMVQFTASAELRDKLERLQGLLRTELPDADVAAVIDRAVTQTLQRLEARRYARTRSPRSAGGGTASALGTSHSPISPAGRQTLTVEPVSAGRHHITAVGRDTATVGRHLPAAVRRAAFERDGGRCRFRDETGRRCPERRRLEYHHLHPFAMGGAHTLDNVRLMCRTHNLYLAEHDYGREAMAAYRRPMQEEMTTATG